MNSTNTSLNFQFSDINQFAFIRPHVTKMLQSTLPDNYFLVEVAINEAVNNALLHDDIDSTGDVILIIKVTNRRLLIRVKNKGKGFAGNQMLKQLRSSTEDPFDQMLFDESGRGLPLMDAAFNCMTFNQSGTDVLLVKNRN